MTKCNHLQNQNEYILSPFHRPHFALFYLPASFQLVSSSSLVCLQWLRMCLLRSLLPYLWRLYLSADIDSASQCTCLANTETFGLQVTSLFQHTLAASPYTKTVWHVRSLNLLDGTVTLAALASCRTLIHGDDCRIRGLNAA